MRTVCIDPGHGGVDSGAVGGGFKEADQTLKIARELEKLLAPSFHVIKTHDGLPPTQKMANMTRCSIANKGGAELYIAIHLNAATSNEANGYEVIHAPGSVKGTRFSELVVQTFSVQIPEIKPRPRPIITDEDTGRGPYTVLRKTSAPAVIVECGFISNEKDRKFLTSASGAKRVASALAKAVEAFFK